MIRHPPCKARALSLLTVSLLTVAFVLPSPARAAEPYLVFVADVDVEKDTGASSGAITPSLCTAIEKRPGLTVLCAPDVRQMLEAAGQLAAFGQSSPAHAKLQQRLDGAHFVVKPYLRKTKDGGLKLLMRLYHQGEASGGMVVPGRPAGRIVELASGTSLTKLLDRLDAAAARAEKMLYEPRNDPGATNEPPAPLQ